MLFQYVIWFRLVNVCSHKSIINITNCYIAKLFVVCFYVACYRSLNSFEMFRNVKMDIFSLNERINLLMASCCADDANSHILLKTSKLYTITNRKFFRITYQLLFRSQMSYYLFAFECNTVCSWM